MYQALILREGPSPRRSHVAGAFFPDSSSTRVSFSTALSSWSSSQPEDLSWRKRAYIHHVLNMYYMHLIVYIHINTYTRIHVHVHINTHTRIHIYVHIHIHTHTYIYIHINTYTRIHVHVHIWMCIYIYT